MPDARATQSTDLEELRRKLEAAQAALDRSVKDHSRFLDLLAHELRNPLAPIRNAMALMELTASGGPALQDACAAVDRQVTRLHRLIDDVGVYSRLAEGRLPLEPEAIDLAKELEAAVAEHRPHLEGLGLALDCEGSPGPLPARADPLRFRQLLGHLLEIAGRRCAPGGRVTVRMTRESETCVRLTVRDTGISLDPEHLDQVFEPFPEDGAIGRGAGLGLGLAVAVALARLQGGQLRALSAGPAPGVEFTAVLPVLTRPEPQSGASAQPNAGSPAGRKILVVEDDPDAAETLRMFLAFHGHAVSVAHTGAEALDLARSARPDLILCDISLAGAMDGYAVARALRALPGLDGACLVAMTGYSREEDRRRALEAGFDAHLVKPVDPAVLRDLVAR